VDTDKSFQVLETNLRPFFLSKV